MVKIRGGRDVQETSETAEVDGQESGEEQTGLAELLDFIVSSRRDRVNSSKVVAPVAHPPKSPAKVDYRRQRGRGRFAGIVTELLRLNKAPMEIAVFLAVDVRSILLVRDRYVAECLQRDERPSDSALLSIRMTAGWTADRRWEHLRRHGYDSAELRRLRKRKSK